MLEAIKEMLDSCPESVFEDELVKLHIDNFDAAKLSSGGSDEKFIAYPNPVKDILNLSYSKEMSNVEVYNILGQQVIAKAINATQSQVDMSQLAPGTYIVKAFVDNQTQTIKVIKE